MTNPFVQIDNKLYAKDLIKSVAIVNAGGTPATYSLHVELRPMMAENNGKNTYSDVGAGYGYGTMPSIGKYTKYEDAEKALKTVYSNLY